MEKEDWRLTGQDKYLSGARLRRVDYSPPSGSWGHDHCEFCWQKFMDRSPPAGAKVDTAGWQTEDAYRWICDGCFTDFREALGFVVLQDNAPTRGVELHDAAVLEVNNGDGFVVVRVHAFVHDDIGSHSCAGCWQRIDLAFYEATLERRGTGEPLVLDGSLRANGEVFDNMLPIPLHEAGAIEVALTGADFELRVRANRVWLRVAGPRRPRRCACPPSSPP